MLIECSNAAEESIVVHSEWARHLDVDFAELLELTVIVR